MTHLTNCPSGGPTTLSAAWDRRWAEGRLVFGSSAGQADPMIEPSQIADVLAAAERDRKALNPFTDEHPDLDTQTAYDAQWAWIEAKQAAGERVVGAKLGLTSKIKQQVMNVDAPLYGWVTDRMLLPYGEPVELSRFIHPRVEPEIAFLIARPIPAPATVTSVLAA